MKERTRGLAALGVALILLGYGLQRLLALAPGLVEQRYSRGIFPLIARTLGSVARLVPFSLAEVLVGLAAILLVRWLILAGVRLYRQPHGRRLAVIWGHAAAPLATLLILLGSIYLAFMLLWGLNYDRRPLAGSIGLQVRPASVSELAALCRDLIDQSNALRQQVREGPDGVMRLDGGVKAALQRASLGYDRAAERYPVLAGRYSPPKPVLISPLWAYTGITGVYFPFTGEANVNIAVPESSIPATATHEMAHQRGFAREDEANYIAYLVGSRHPDADFRYSSSLLAMESAMAALRGADPKQYAELVSRHSAGVRRDLAAEDAFWQAHAGPVERASNRINDQYLKANLQAEGVGSYGRMVDLLLAEYRARRNP